MAKQEFKEHLKVDLFISPPDIELICPICQCVLKDAQQLSTCGHMFCKHCITTHLQSTPATNYCPVDRRVAQLDNIVAAPRPIVNIISRLLLKCFNHKEGCPFILTVDNLLRRHSPICTRRVRTRTLKEAVGPNSEGIPIDKDFPINVLVKMLTSPYTIGVTINSESTVRILKLRIHDKVGIDPNSMLLTFNGKILNNESEVLSQYSVKSNDVFFMARSFGSGPPFGGAADHSN